MAHVSQHDSPWMPLWAPWIGGGWGCIGKMPGYGAREKEVLQLNYLVPYFLVFLCLALQHSILPSWYLKKKTPWEFTHKSLDWLEGFPSVLISKTVRDIPRAGRLRALAITSDSHGYRKLLAAMGPAQAGAYPAQAAVLWGVRDVSCLQKSETQKHRDFLSSRQRWLGHPQISVYSPLSYLHCIPVRPKLPLVQIPFQPQFLLQYDFPTSLFPSLILISISF